ncbi:MAG: hypothetical protein ABIK82_11720 [Pseudomonadota bacterium]
MSEKTGARIAPPLAPPDDKGKAHSTGYPIRMLPCHSGIWKRRLSGKTIVTAWLRRVSAHRWRCRQDLALALRRSGALNARKQSSGWRCLSLPDNRPPHHRGLANGCIVEFVAFTLAVTSGQSLII